MDFSAPLTAAPGTPGAEDASSATAGTATAPNTEFKKLSTAALGIFSPTTARSQSEYSLNILAGAAAAAGNATPFETPRKRNSVLINANPDMLNTLNKMLMNSPAATPLKNSRQSLFGAASASKFAIKNAAAGPAGKPSTIIRLPFSFTFNRFTSGVSTLFTFFVDADENPAAPEVKPVTRSKLLMVRKYFIPYL